MALVAGGVAAVAALGVATGLAAGSGARPPVIVAGAVLLAAAAGAALLEINGTGAAMLGAAPTAE
jgi:hypothetical protein